MLDHLTMLYLQISEATKSNPILAGAVSLWGLGVVTILCRKIPQQIWHILISQCTTTLVINNAGYWGNREVFLAFIKWYGSTNNIKWSRQFSLDKSYEQGIVVGPGFGNHYLIYNGRFFRFTKGKLDSSGSENQKEEIYITMLGRDQSHIHKLIDAFKPIDNEDALYAYRLDRDNQWIRVTELQKRPLNSVIIPTEIKSSIVKQLTEFYSMRNWYLSKGLSHKMTIMLHGVPGCGKTSLIKALAGHYGADLYILNVNSISDSSLESVLSRIPKGSLLSLEDIDSTSAVHRRSTPLYSVDTAVPEKTMSGLSVSTASEFSFLSLTGILNALDGAIPLDNIVVFMTTNHIEVIDDALLRKGRTDHIFELNYLQDNEIKEFVRYSYGDHEQFNEAALNSQTYSPMAGCNLNSLILTHKKNYADFKKELDGHSNF